jgi:hypothetical protein
MAEDLSPTHDPPLTEWPSPAARLTIMVGPDPPGGGTADGRPLDGRTPPARRAQELLADADGPAAVRQEPGAHDQKPGAHSQGAGAHRREGHRDQLNR